MGTFGDCFSKLVGSLILGLVVEVAILNKAKGSKAKGHFKLQIRGLIGIECCTLGFKVVVVKAFLGALIVKRTMEIGIWQAIVHATSVVKVKKVVPKGK